MTESGHKAQRTCLGCRKVLERNHLVRYVLAPDGELTVDYRGKLPGRGAYSCVNRVCVEEAVRRRQFNRAFRTDSLKVDGSALLGELAAQIRERVLNLLGMARKSGMAVSGSSLVLDQLAGSGDFGLVLVADDISETIGRKLAGRAEVRSVTCVKMFEKDILGQLLGKGERSAVALKRGLLAESIKNELLLYEQIVGER